MIDNVIKASLNEIKEATEYIEIIQNNLYYLQRIMHIDVDDYPKFGSDSIFIKLESNASIEIKKDRFHIIIPWRNINEDQEYHSELITEFDMINVSPYKKMSEIISHFVRIYRDNFDLE